MLLAASAVSFAHAADHFNILSLDSAKYKGYMTASFVDAMERQAYKLANDQYCIPTRKSARIAMPELFDMVAGSETGAIIASSLVVKNENPKTKSIQENANFADKSVNWFEKNVDILYHDNKMPMLLQFFITTFIVIFFSYAIYHWTDKTFYHPYFD